MRRLPALVLVGALAGCAASQPRAEPARSPLHALVDQAAVKHGVPRRIAHGVVRAESGYRCTARNRRSGATGIMQVLPRTARGVGIHGNLTDCNTGLEAGMRYLRLALDRGGVGCAGVSLYERGIYARPVCTGYGKKVMSGL